LDKLEKFQDQFKESVTKGLMPLSKLQEDISDLKQVLADLLDKLTDRDNRIQNIEKKIHKDTKKKEMHEQLKTFEQKLQRLPAGTADHLHERLAIIKGTPKPTNDLPLPIPPMPTNNKNINSHDLEFSSGGSHDLSPLGDLDIPPPPKVKKKGLFSKLLGK
jgi:hypothetical protein